MIRSALASAVVRSSSPASCSPSRERDHLLDQFLSEWPNTGPKQWWRRFGHKFAKFAGFIGRAGLQAFPPMAVMPGGVEDGDDGHQIAGAAKHDPVGKTPGKAAADAQVPVAQPVDQGIGQQRIDGGDNFVGESVA
jgi:hypothetical protein